MIDYHVHTAHSGDCKSDVFALCQRAVELGITEIGFTDHLDFEPSDSCYGAYDYDGFMRDVENARDKFGEKLVIRAGLEVDYQTWFHEQIVGFLEGKSFDYIIGSAHYVNRILLEKHERYFPGKTALEAYLPYFDAVEAAVESGLFDILAHLDLCKRYGSIYFGEFPFEVLRERISSVLKSVIDAGMALEINTSGLRQAPKDTYPSFDIISLYHDLGGRYVTVGSDAHTVEDLGSGVKETLEKLNTEGICEVARFHKRRLCVDDESGPAGITMHQP